MKIISLVIVFLMLAGNVFGKIITSVHGYKYEMPDNYKLVNKDNNIKSLKDPHIIICTHRIGMEYIERQIINSELKNSKIQVNLILADTIYSRLFNIFNIFSNSRYIYIKGNTVQKGIKSLNDNKHLCTFYYKNQSRKSTGIYYITMSTKKPILLAKIKYYKNTGLKRLYTLEYVPFKYNTNDSKEEFLKKLSDKLFE